MAFNQGNVPPSTGYVIDSSNQYIPDSSIYAQSGAASYYHQAGHVGATQDTMAQMAQLSLAAGVQQQQQQQQQLDLGNQTSFQGQPHQMADISANGHLGTPQQPTAMYTMPQTFSPGHHPTSVIQSPVSIHSFPPGHVAMHASLPAVSHVSPNAHQAIYNMTAVPSNINPLMTGQQQFQSPVTALPNQPTMGMVPNTQTAAFIGGPPTSGVHPFYLHGVQVSPPHQQQQSQQIFAYDPQILSTQPPQTLPLQSATILPSHTEISQNIAETVDGTQEIPYGYVAGNASYNAASADYQTGKTELNALPHSMPTTLNPSLQKRRASSSGELTSPRNESNNLLLAQHNYDARRASDVVDQVTSPRGDPVYHYQSGNPFVIHEEHSIPDMRSPVFSSPLTPEQALPVYEIPIHKDVCLRCLKKVYVVERVGPIKDAIYHKNCFSCAVCKSKLTMKSFHHNPNDMDDVNVYCVSHKQKSQNIASEANAYYIKQGSKGPHQIEAEFQPAVVIQPQDNPLSAVQDSGVVTQETVMNPVVPTSPADNRTQNEVTLRRSMSEDMTKSPDIETAQLPLTPSSSQTPLTPQTPSYRRVSAPCTGASSPYSSISSSSSYAAALKMDAQADSNPVIDHPDGSGSLVRSDRPSSSSSSVTSLEILSKPEVDSPTRQNGSGNDANQKKVPFITSDCLERQDRPSNNLYQSESNEIRRGRKDPASRMVKSNSADEPSTGNGLGNKHDQSNILTLNESKRLDRPSQNQ